MAELPIPDSDTHRHVLVQPAGDGPIIELLLVSEKSVQGDIEEANGEV